MVPGRREQVRNLQGGAGTFPGWINSVPMAVKHGGVAEPGESKEKEQAMRLNSTQVKQTLSQFDAQVLPDDHPAVTQLSNLFGDHTFFLDGAGLKVLEPNEAPEADAQTGEVVSLADWSDASLTSLKPHEPQSTGLVVVLESKH
jgi:hypothetical protein